MSIDWEALRQAARTARTQAYAPYSNFPVGAAGFTSDGHVVSGCNIENASYGVTLCAECGLVSELVRSGGGKLTALLVLDSAEAPLPPCGRCRQLLSEHVTPEARILLSGGEEAFAELMPHAFGADNLS
jgi:cytidine deaminase